MFFRDPNAPENADIGKAVFEHETFDEWSALFNVSPKYILSIQLRASALTTAVDVCVCMYVDQHHRYLLCDLRVPLSPRKRSRRSQVSLYWFQAYDFCHQYHER
jgi:hypothetical protein